MLILLLSLLLAPQDDAAVVGTLAAFDETFSKNKDSAARAEQIATLAQTQHEKIVSRLGLYLTHEDKSVRMAAVQGLSTFATATAELKKSATKAMLSGLSATVNKAEVDLKKAILAGLGTIGDESSVSGIKIQLDDKDLGVATAAVNAAVALRTKSLIEPLIDQLRECEKTMRAGANPTFTGTGKKPVSAKKGDNEKPDPEEQKRDRAANLVNVLHSALQGLTGQVQLSAAADWSKWWASNGKTFTLPK